MRNAGWEPWRAGKEVGWGADNSSLNVPRAVYAEMCSVPVSPVKSLVKRRPVKKWGWCGFRRMADESPAPSVGTRHHPPEGAAANEAKRGEGEQGGGGGLGDGRTREIYQGTCQIIFSSLLNKRIEDSG